MTSYSEICTGNIFFVKDLRFIWNDKVMIEWENYCLNKEEFGHLSNSHNEFLLTAFYDGKYNFPTLEPIHNLMARKALASTRRSLKKDKRKKIRKSFTLTTCFICKNEIVNGRATVVKCDCEDWLKRVKFHKKCAVTSAQLKFKCCMRCNVWVLNPRYC